MQIKSNQYRAINTTQKYCQIRYNQNSSPVNFTGNINIVKKLKNVSSVGDKISDFVDSSILQMRYLSEFISDRFLIKKSTYDQVLKQEEAAKKFGVKAYYNDDMWLGEAVNSILRKLKQHGHELPNNIWSCDMPFDAEEISRFDKEDISELYGAIYPGFKTIIINGGHSWGMMGRSMEKLHSEGVISSPDSNHFIWHQFGNFLQDFYNHSTALKHEGVEFQEKELTKIAQDVSKAATYCHNNFVAEVFAGKVAGKNYDSSIMEMFNDFGGVSLNK